MPPIPSNAVRHAANSTVLQAMIACLLLVDKVEEIVPSLPSFRDHPTAVDDDLLVDFLREGRFESLFMRCFPLLA